jgi:hypothetical protein
MAVAHLLAHGQHLVFELGGVARQGEDIASDGFELVAD